MLSSDAVELEKLFMLNGGEDPSLYRSETRRRLDLGYFEKYKKMNPDISVPLAVGA